MQDNRDIGTVRSFHEFTKHSYISVRTTAHRLDWSNRPHPFKIYLDRPTAPLPHDFPKPQMDTLSAIRGLEVKAPRRVDVKVLASLLYFTAGITRVKTYPDGRIYFRAAPATGALYPIEVYVVSGDVDGLEAGVYHFSPAPFQLTRIREGDYRWMLGRSSSHKMLDSQATLVFTSIGWRNAWKYRERSYRHWFWDSGVMVANLLAAASALDVGAELVMGFVDEDANRLVGVDGRSEAAILLTPLGEGSPPAAQLEAEPIKPVTKPLSRHVTEYPEIHKVHQASSLSTAEEVGEWVRRCGEPSDEWRVNIQEPTIQSSKPLWETILMRGSTRMFSREPITLEALKTILACCTSTISADFIPPSSSYTSIYLIVNSVEGLPPGSYFYDRVDGGLEQLKRGEFRRVAGYLCLEQELGEDASVVFFLMTDLEKTLNSMGNRGYRAVQLEAGVIAGRIYLASYALGLGATGLTFYDDDVTEFFSPQAADKSNMMVVAVGKPAYRAKPGRIILGSD
ncbi:MAG: SagB/ThcOx family dehydrogenase [Nitrososphaerota archaeon]